MNDLTRVAATFEFIVCDNSEVDTCIDENKHPKEDFNTLEYSDGTKSWYKNGSRHRVDGPAYSSPKHNEKQWWVDNRLHRIDGPAITSDNHVVWYVNGIQTFDAVHFRELAKISDEEMVILALKWGQVGVSDWRWGDE